MGGNELERSREWGETQDDLTRLENAADHGMGPADAHEAHFWRTIQPVDVATHTRLQDTMNDSCSPVSSLNIPTVRSTSTESSHSEDPSPRNMNGTRSTEGNASHCHLRLGQRRAIISKSRRGGIVQKCIDSLSSLQLIHQEPIFITGAGYKTMKLLIGEENETLWFFPKPGTSLWDVAAADALLRVMGGRISDKFGKDLDYSKGRLEADNMDGIIACSDGVLHAKCLELYKKEGWDD
mmetsp:Transcript_4574/g.6961  ORF Transcript_4574/g.6961 Transcript_4574/m.6961 type:complete len:238 (-) Transcript_4574:224-937(-)